MLPSLRGDVKPLVLSPSSLNKRFRGKNLLRNELPWFSSHTTRSKSPRQGWTGEKPTHTNSDSQGYAKNTGPPTNIIDFHLAFVSLDALWIDKHYTKNWIYTNLLNVNMVQKVQTRRKLKAKMVNTAFACQFTWGCKF